MKNHLIASVLQASLRHQPIRHGLMQTAAHYAATGQKYRETTTPPTAAQISAHLNGRITLAAPACANGLAACIVIDLDDHALTAITDLLTATEQHGLWAWGEVHEATDRGYLYVPFADLVNAATLKHLGDTLIAAAGLQARGAKDVDNRTANQAITRLPFGVHRQTMRRGLLIFPDGDSHDLNTALDAGLQAWCDRYHENPAPMPAAPPPLLPADQRAPAPRTATTSHHRLYEYQYSAAEIQRWYNERHDVCTILAQHHATRSSRSSWHCPCGQHNHGDRSASLQIKKATNPKYGAYIVQGFSPACRFFSNPRTTYDAFNVYAALNGLSNAEMLKYARQDLGLEAHTPAERDPDSTDHHERRRAPRPAAPRETAATNTAEIRQRALQAFMIDHVLTSATRRIYTYLCSTAKGLSCRPSMARIAHETGMHPRTAQRAMRQLEQRGHITTNHTENAHGDQTSIYTISVPTAFLPPDIKACKGGAVVPPVAPIPELAPPAPETSIATISVPTAFLPPDIKACKGGAVVPPVAPIPELAPPAPAPPSAPPAPDVAPVVTPVLRVFPRPGRPMRPIHAVADPAPPPPPPPVAAPAPAASAQATPAPPVPAPAASIQAEPDGASFDEAAYWAWAARPVAYSGIPRTKSQTQLAAQLRADHAAQDARNAADRAAAPPPPPPPPPLVQGSIPTSAAPVGDHPADGLAVLRDCVMRLRAAAIADKTTAAWGRYHREQTRLGVIERRMIARAAPTHAPPLHAGRKLGRTAVVPVQRGLVQQALGSMDDGLGDGGGGSGGIPGTGVPVNGGGRTRRRERPGNGIRGHSAPPD